ARIKKIMQADDEVGKIAMATPVLISKALELFLQDLCDRTYEITIKKGAKTISSHHLKECVCTIASFDFLKETVSSVPDLEVEAGGGSDTSRRRKPVEVDSGEGVIKRSRTDAFGGRGRGRGSNNERARNGETKSADKSSETNAHCPKDFDLNIELNENGEVAKTGKALEQDLQPLGMGLCLGHIQNVFQTEDDYDADDE
ncbi:hypothetical protein GOP47_0024853, partial [Adiantum capillus-veneris]